jgi:hypothetical protein
MKPFAFLLLLSLVAGAAAAQAVSNPAPYWVVESNVSTPKKSLVHFYSGDHTLMQSMVVEGKELKIHRRRVARRLNTLLDSVVERQARSLALREKREEK